MILQVQNRNNSDHCRQTPPSMFEKDVFNPPWVCQASLWDNLAQKLWQFRNATFNKDLRVNWSIQLVNAQALYEFRWPAHPLPEDPRSQLERCAWERGFIEKTRLFKRPAERRSRGQSVRCIIF